MLPVDLTSTWIPLSLLAVLCTYMFVLFQRERRASLAFEGMEAAAPHAGSHVGSHDNSPTASHEAPAASAPAEMAHVPATPAKPAHVVPAHAAEPEKAKSSLIWRTAHIWLPFVAGFAGQGYLDIIKPMIAKAAG